MSTELTTSTVVEHQGPPPNPPGLNGGTSTTSTPLTIHFHDLSSTAMVPSHDATIPHICSPLTHLAARITSCGKDKKPFHRVHGVSGCIHPKSMTLVIAPPGGGKSTYLRLLANRISPDKDSSILYNGKTVTEARGGEIEIDVRKMVRYMDQSDQNLPLLTVSETLHFVARSNCHTYDPQRVDRVIQQLGLIECRETLIGNALIRGISGGQARRVSIGEVMCTDAQVMCLDQYTDGLDSATALEITQTLKNWTVESNGSVVATLQQPGPEITALFDHIIILNEGSVIFDGHREDVAAYFRAMGFIQPLDQDLVDFVINCLIAPDIMHRQSEVELQRQQGMQVTNIQMALGTKAKRQQRLTISGARLAGLAQQQPGHLSVPQLTAPISTITEDVTISEEEPSTISEGPGAGLGDTPGTGNLPGSAVASSPSTTTRKTKKTKPAVMEHDPIKIELQRPVPCSLGTLTPAQEPCLDAELMLNYYHKSPFYTTLLHSLRPIFPTGSYSPTIPANNNTYQHRGLAELDTEKARYSTHRSLCGTKTWSVFGRELRVLSRSRALFIPRFLIYDVIMSLLYGGLYFDIPVNDYYLRISGLLIGLTNTALANRVEVPVYFDHNQTALRQISHGYYPAWTFVIASFVRSFPMCFVDCIFFTFILYFMSAHALYAWTFVLFFLLLLVQSLNLSIIFKFLTSLASSVEAGQANAQTVLNFFMVFGGFFIGRSAVVKPMLPLYWVSVFSWTNRALSINEFTSPRYDKLVPFTNPSTGVTETLRLGHIYLRQADMYTSRWWILWCFIYLIGLSIFFIVAHALYLRSSSYYLQGTRGTRRSQEGKLNWDEHIQDDDDDFDDGDSDVEFVSMTSASGRGLDNHPEHQDDTGVIIANPSGFPQQAQPHPHPHPPGPRMAVLANPSAFHSNGTDRFEQKLIQDTQIAVIRNYQRSGAITSNESKDLIAQAIDQSHYPPPPPTVLGRTGSSESTDRDGAAGRSSMKRTSLLIASDHQQHHLPRKSLLATRHPDQRRVTSLDTAMTQQQQQQQSNDDIILPTLGAHLPFAPTWISFDNITYSVKAATNKQEQPEQKKRTYDKVLLHGISGYARPGQFTALLGSSGAGKSTLLDLLSFRKTTGTMSGSILCNGQPATRAQISSITGYVEQVDSLFAYQTVWETLNFVAVLKLPRSMTTNTRNQIIEELLDVLEISDIRDRLIGNRKIPGLSSSQLKRVNICIELLGNPSVLFLDEPTTGLNAAAAMTVIRICRKIANSGRTVIATIHQPSTSLFYQFDSLVLLGAGGHQLYFGELGYRSARFIQYLSRCPFITAIKPQTNPAAWLLNEAGVFNPYVGKIVEFQDFWGQFPIQIPEYGKTLTDTINPHPTEKVLLTAPLLIQTLHNCFINSRQFAFLQYRLKLLSSLTVDVSLDGEGEGMTELATQPQQPPQPPSHTNNNNQRPKRFSITTSIDPLATLQIAGAHDGQGSFSTGSRTSDQGQQPPPPPSIHLAQRPSTQPSPAALVPMDGEAFPKSHSSSEIRNLAEREKFAQASATSEPIGDQIASFFIKFWVLLKRNHSAYWRNPSLVFVRLCTCLILSLLFGIIYLDINTTTLSGMISRLSSICVVIYFSANVHGASVPSLESRVVFYRERSSFYYPAVLWNIVAFLNEAFWGIWGTFFTSIAFYFLTELPTHAGTFFLYSLTMYMIILSYSSTSLMIASLSPSSAVANLLNGAFLGLSFLFSGLTVTMPQAARGWIWLFRMLPLSHGVEMAIQVFENDTTLVNILSDDNSIIQIPFRDAISSYLGMQYNNYWGQFGWLCLYLVVTQTIATIATVFLIFQKR